MDKKHLKKAKASWESLFSKAPAIAAAGSRSGASPKKQPKTKGKNKGRSTTSGISAKVVPIYSSVPRRLSLGINDRTETVVQGLGTLMSFNNSGSILALAMKERPYYDSSTGAVAVNTVSAVAQNYFVPVSPTDNSSFSFQEGKTPTAKYAGWAHTYVRDVFKYFSSYTVNSAKLVIVPRGWGANTATAISAYVVPRRGGRPDLNGSLFVRADGTFPTSTTIGVPDTSVLLASKGAIEFPVSQGLEMDLTPYIAGGYGAKQNEFDTQRSLSDVAGTTDATGSAEVLATTFGSVSVQPQYPFSLLFGGSNMQASATGAYAELADVFIIWNVRLNDFNVAFSGGVNFPNPLSRLALPDCKGAKPVAVGGGSSVPVGGDVKTPPNSPTQSLSGLDFKPATKSNLSVALANAVVDWRGIAADYKAMQDAKKKV